MTSPEMRMADLLATFGSPTACTVELLCDRHPADAVAFTLVQPDLTGRNVTFGELKESSARMACALANLGVGAGDRVATLMGGIRRAGLSPCSPSGASALCTSFLFTAFAPPAIGVRITGNETKAVFVDADQRAKLGPSPAFPADAGWRIITTGPAVDGTLAFADLDRGVSTAGTRRRRGRRRAHHRAVHLRHDRRSPTGRCCCDGLCAPKAMYSQEHAVDHRPSDAALEHADLARSTGPVLVVALACSGSAAPAILPALVGSASRLILGRYFRSSLSPTSRQRRPCTAPCVTLTRRSPRTSRPAGTARPRVQPPHSGCGIPWAERTLGVPVLDHYGQTELGMTVANAWHPDLRGDVRPGSMGRALAGRDPSRSPGRTIDSPAADDRRYPAGRRRLRPQPADVVHRLSGRRRPHGGAVQPRPALVLHRRRRDEGRGRISVLRRPRRRHHPDGRLPHRAVPCGDQCSLPTRPSPRRPSSAPSTSCAAKCFVAFVVLGRPRRSSARRRTRSPNSSKRSRPASLLPTSILGGSTSWPNYPRRPAARPSASCSDNGCKPVQRI